MESMVTEVFWGGWNSGIPTDKFIWMLVAWIPSLLLMGPRPSFCVGICVGLFVGL